MADAVRVAIAPVDGANVRQCWAACVAHRDPRPLDEAYVELVRAVEA